MKILVFSPYYPPHIGGLEAHADEFNKYLSQEGVDITVFTPRLPLEASEFEERHQGVKIIRFPAIELIHNYPLPKFWLPSFWKLLGQAARQRPDLILSRTRFFSTSLLALAYAKLKRVPWVHIEHGSDFAKFNGAFKTRLGEMYDHIFGRLVLACSDKNIANSLASSRFVETLSGRHDCQVIYRGVETETILQVKPNQSLRQRYVGKTLIGFIGRLIDGKGVIDLLQALANISEKDFACFIVGDGPERAALEKFIKDHNLTEKVIFFGHKNFIEAIAILKSCDIFVNPSYTEGIPTSVIEAALCQKAILTTDVGGTPEIITGKGDGIFIKPKDITALQKHLEKLLGDSALREALAHKAFETVREKFHWPRAAKQYLEVFNALLNKK
jgi:glycosyltransferase involved in cell wall biosynthesis